MQRDISLIVLLAKDLTEAAKAALKGRASSVITKGTKSLRLIVSRWRSCPRCRDPRTPLHTIRAAGSRDPTSSSCYDATLPEIGVQQKSLVRPLGDVLWQLVETKFTAAPPGLDFVNVLRTSKLTCSIFELFSLPTPSLCWSSR